MKVWFTLIFLSAACFAASAQTLYKCEQKGQPTSYQTQPCSTASAIAKTWDATPEPEPSNAEKWRRYSAKQRGEADSRYLSRLAGRGHLPMGQGRVVNSQSTNSGIDRCALAKRQRDDYLNGPGRDAGIDSRRALHDSVYDACK